MEKLELYRKKTEFKILYTILITRKKSYQQSVNHCLASCRLHE